MTFWMGRDSAPSVKAVFLSHVSLEVPHSCVHLFGGHLPMLDCLGVQDVSDILVDPVQEDFILKSLQLLVSEEPLPVFSQTIYSIGDPDQEVSGILGVTLFQVFN